MNSAKHSSANGVAFNCSSERSDATAHVRYAASNDGRQCVPNSIFNHRLRRSAQLCNLAAGLIKVDALITIDLEINVAFDELRMRLCWGSHSLGHSAYANLMADTIAFREYLRT